MTQELSFHDVAGLQLAVLTGSDVERNGGPFVKSLEAVHLDLREMDEEILAISLGDEAVALLGVEPLNSTLRHFIPLFSPRQGRRVTLVLHGISTRPHLESNVDNYTLT